jgi:hypothetical protein
VSSRASFAIIFASAGSHDVSISYWNQWMGLRVSVTPFFLIKSVACYCGHNVILASTGYVPDASQLLEPVNRLAGTLTSLDLQS